MFLAFNSMPADPISIDIANPQHGVDGVDKVLLRIIQFVEILLPDVDRCWFVVSCTIHWVVERWGEEFYHCSG